MTYSVNDYIDMIGDPHRTGAYVRALRKMVTRESVVLDIGAGFGFFAVLAAKLGAKRAYAIEPNDAIGLGPALARANGVADRVSFFQGDARQVELDERANLLVEDVRGILPLHAERVNLLCDARERLLTADARFVACRDHIWAAPARHAPSLQQSIETTGADMYGVDLRGLRGHVVDDARRRRPAPDELLLPGAPLGALDLLTVTDPNFDGTARWTPSTTVTADGFVLWFDAELAEGEGFSTRPGPEQTIHGCLYLPLREPLAVPAGAELALRFCGVQVSRDYTWTWECTVTRAGASVVRTPRQSALGGLALTPARLAAMSELHQPTLGLEARRLRAVIDLMEVPRQSGDLAVVLAAQRALEFTNGSDAFDWLQRVLPQLESGTTRMLK
ncbi:MAG: 50S ribosomal protein L11 methyltransferase [Gemmatimonadaceae bacterium]|jgi:SAM-dependent methyltransferase